MDAHFAPDARFEDAPCPLCGGEKAAVVVRAPDRLRPGEPILFTVVRCDACGLAYTRPRPTPQTMGLFYPPSYAGSTRSSLVEKLEGTYRARQQREVLRWLAQLRPRRGRVLDVGCGRGDLLLALSGDGWQASGLEPTPQGTAVARARGLDVTLGRFEDLDPSVTSYDVVVFAGVLEHLHDPLGSLRRARGSLAPGGLVAALYVPLFDSPQARVFGRRWLALDLPRHLTHFESTTFPRFAARAGLRIAAARDYSRRHNASQLIGSLCPALQKHRLYLAEEGAGGRSALSRGLAPAAKRAAYAGALTAALPVSRAEAALDLTPMRSYFLEAEG
jgi:SAM-dependent methyltransferase